MSSTLTRTLPAIGVCSELRQKIPSCDFRRCEVMFCERVKDTGMLGCSDCARMQEAHNDHRDPVALAL